MALTRFLVFPPPLLALPKIRKPALVDFFDIDGFDRFVLMPLFSSPPSSSLSTTSIDCEIVDRNWQNRENPGYHARILA